MARGKIVQGIGALLGAAALTVAVAAPSSAAVVPHSKAAPYKTLICDKGGFTGVLNVYRASKYHVALTYQIYKGSNKGGNKANVDVTDAGTLPPTKLSTSSGIQDGKEHDLGGAYDRGDGTMGVKFTFDKSYASDPSCTTTLYFNSPV